MCQVEYKQMNGSVREQRSALAMVMAFMPKTGKPFLRQSLVPCLGMPPTVSLTQLR
ncbi:unnamed protein product [Haemonchus placei]|uniref:Transposase n=1 Tax=Haemonchus placei TaxID=6290 RepID=A0A0N4WJJ6_HAEPC|nr:unnamed protein product [Haemonchus placei]